MNSKIKESKMRIKKGIFIYLAGVMLFSDVAGCGDRDTVKQQEVKEEGAEQIIKEAKEQRHDKKEKKEKQRQEKDLLKEKFSITAEVYEDGDIHIEYPQIENLVDEDITEWYNEQFKSTVVAYTEGDIEEGDIAGNCERVNESFQITYQSDDMISILIEGYYEAEGAAHPYSYMSSYNINLKTGESMGITDQYTPEELVDTLFSGENYTGISDVDNMEEMSEEEMQYLSGEISARDREYTLESMQKCDYKFTLDAEGKMKKGEEDVYMYSVRLKDGKWALCLDITHALGDCVIVRYDK